MSKKFYLESLGCAKNLVDSETFASILKDAGYQLSFNVEGADIVFINTCAFLQSSLQELETVLATVEELKNEHKVGRVIVSGCVMNRAAKSFKEAFPSVDEWIGLQDFEALRRILGIEKSETRTQLEPGFHAYLRISDGCENYCSYCKIPSIRGKLHSIPIESLVKEAEALAKRPCIDRRGRLIKPATYPQELILIAQDSCMYGTDIYGHKALPELIEALHRLDAFPWIRIMYLHPDHFEPKWLELFARYPKLLPYFEIPVQHVQPEILTAMHRKLSGKQLTELFSQIISKIPTAALRTTLMTGFPGESTRYFNALLRFIEEVPLLHMGSFAYSAEDGTPAEKMMSQVPIRTALARQNRLESKWFALQEERWQTLVGSRVQVLTEELKNPKNNEFKGRAWFQAPEIDGEVIFHSASAVPGSIVEVEIDDLIGNTLFGHGVN